MNHPTRFAIRKPLRRFGLYLVCAVCAPATTFAANYYVSPTGNDANPGTLSLPLKTPHRAVRVVQPGDTVFFRGGDYVYDKFLYINGAYATAAAPITFRAYPGEKPVFVWDRKVIDPNATSSIVYVGRPYYIFDGLGIRETETSRRLSLIGADYIDFLHR